VLAGSEGILEAKNVMLVSEGERVPFDGLEQSVDLLRRSSLVDADGAGGYGFHSEMNTQERLDPVVLDGLIL
jgi:hypothetical protein